MGSSKRATLDESFFKKFGADRKEIERVTKKYPMKVTPYYLSLIKKRDDPIWKQSIPNPIELEDTRNVEDPLQEEHHTKVPYLVHKYPDRALLLVSSTCAMYCRFCTRKRKVGRIKQIPMEDIFKAIQYIKKHKEVRDVIVSGGDPLMRKDSELEKILKELRSIPHVEIIRIGTRVPCVLPSRITKRTVNMIKKYSPIYMNIHFNHPSEITPESSKACNMLADAGILLGSQTVLLKGINDDVKTIKELMHKLLMMRVKPYYVYQCDLVKGVEHFRTDVRVAIKIMKGLQGFTSGLAIPHFVIDSSGGGKVPIYPHYIQSISEDKVVIKNYLDNTYEYPNPKKK